MSHHARAARIYILGTADITIFHRSKSFIIMLLRTFLVFSTLFFFHLVTAQDTFSIVAYDAETGEIGSAGASCLDDTQFPGSGGVQLISDVIPGRGAVHTQSFYLEGNQATAHSRLMQGESATAIIDHLQRNDVEFNPAVRQYGAVTVDENGNSDAAAFTGDDCFDWKGHKTSNRYAIQGNILLGEEIIANMEVAFNRTEGTLADRLMAAMQAAKIPGADTRCLDEGVSSLSAFLRVAKPTDTADNLYLDLNVPATPFGVEPIDALQDLYDDFLLTNTLESSSNIIVNTYPNPTGEQIILEFKTAPKNIVEFSIFDLNGKVVFTSSQITHRQTIIPTSNWLSGIYTLKIKTVHQATIYQKIIKS